MRPSRTGGRSAVATRRALSRSARSSRVDRASSAGDRSSKSRKWRSIEHAPRFLSDRPDWISRRPGIAEGTSPRIAHPSSICSSVMFNAGQEPDHRAVGRVDRGASSIQALRHGRRGVHASAPGRSSRRGCGRLEISAGNLLGDSAAKCPRNRSPIDAARSSSPSSSIVSMVAIPARQAIGLPPNVLACMPGLERPRRRGNLASITPAATPAGQGLGAGQEVGLDPEMLVGEPGSRCGPSRSGPRRGSATPPWSSQSERSPSRYPQAAGSLIPPSPWIGSIITAAVVGVDRPSRRHPGRCGGHIRSRGPSARSLRGTSAGRSP